MKWALKIAAKLCLSRIPIHYHIWNSLGVFRHGQMGSLEYSVKIFQLHITRAYSSGLPRGSVILELGPGDSVASALLGFTSGASMIYLVDVGRYARKDVAFYQKIANALSALGYAVPNLSAVKSIDDILEACNAQYLVNGLSSLQTIPSDTVDFVWSHSVLEHIRKDELQRTFAELRRITKQGGLMSHNIDYQDHLSHGLNNLRFSEMVWESRLFAESGFYTNRVPAIVLHKMLKDAEFDVLSEEFGKWSSLPLQRSSMHEDFRSFSDHELINRTSHILLT